MDRNPSNRAKNCGDEQIVRYKPDDQTSHYHSPNNPEPAPHSKGLTGAKMPLGYRFSRQPAFVDLR
jgi:hypothetical protein